MRAMTASAWLDDRALIRVSGDGARAFLHNLLTQDVEGLREGELRYGALLTPQGRLQHAVFLLGEADGSVLVDCAAAECEALVGRLTLYRLRAKVGIEALDGPVSAAWGPGDVDAGEGWRVDPRLPALGWRRYPGPGSAPGGEGGEPGDYDAHRLRLGAPDPAVDCPDPTYPIEADFDLLNAIDFKKGCFVGQETTSRMKRRGTIKTRLCPLVFDGPPPPPGTEVLASGERRAGEVRSGRDGRALAFLRLDRAFDGPLTAGGMVVTPDPPDWLQSAFSLERLATVNS